MTTINLLPWRAALRIKRARQFNAAAAGALIAGILLVGALHTAVSARLAAQQNRNDYLNHEIGHFKKRQNRLQALKAEETRLLNRIEAIEGLQLRRPLTGQLLDAVSGLISDDIRLTRIQQRDRSLEIRGLADAGVSISGFMRRLGDSAHFSKPELVSIRGKNQGDAARVEFVVRTEQRILESGAHQQAFNES